MPHAAGHATARPAVRNLPPATFAQRFCRHFAVPPERFAGELLRRTLYLHARPLIRIGCHDSFAADRDFVDSVGRLTRQRDFSGEAREFQHDPRNRLFWRHHARLRVSVGRMQRLFAAVWSGSAGN